MPADVRGLPGCLILVFAQGLIDGTAEPGAAFVTLAIGADEEKGILTNKTAASFLPGSDRCQVQGL